MNSIMEQRVIGCCPNLVNCHAVTNHFVTELWFCHGVDRDSH